MKKTTSAQPCRSSVTLPPCPFAAEVEVTIDRYNGVRRRACAAAFITLLPSGPGCVHCPNRGTPAADAVAHLQQIRNEPYVTEEQRAVIDRVLTKTTADDCSPQPQRL